MMNFWSFNRIYSLAKIDLKGLGKWFVFTILLSIVIGRMKSSVSEDGSFIYTFTIMPYIILSLGYVLYNAFCNMPQIIKTFPFSSRDEVNNSIVFIVTVIGALFLLWAFAGTVGYNIMCLTNAPEVKALSFIGVVREIMNAVISGQVLFQVLFYVLLIACIFPCIFVKKTKVWYLAMGSILVAFSLFVLFMINRLPENIGRFSTRGDVVANFSTISNGNIILCIMGILAVIALPISYRLSLKINSPKRYIA